MDADLLLTEAERVHALPWLADGALRTVTICQVLFIVLCKSTTCSCWTLNSRLHLLISMLGTGESEAFYRL